MNTNSWLKYTQNVNRLGNTYIRDFLDVSGNIALRNGNFNITEGDISMNSSFYILNSGALKLNSDNAGSYFQSGSNLTTGSTQDIVFSGINKIPEYIRIKGQTGYVGINTSNPGYHLHVNGSSRFSVAPIMLGTNIYSGTYNDSKYNTGVGNFALYSNNYNNISHNTALGCYSLYETTGNYNSAMGYYASYQQKLNGNSAFGSYCLHKNDGYNNAGFGYKTIYNRFGNSNTSFGAYSMYNLYMETNNISNNPNIANYYNTAFGYYSMNIYLGNHNNAFGSYAMYSKQNITTGYYQNTAVGSNCLLNVMSSNNTGFGGNSLLSLNTTSGTNTAIGYETLSKINTASNLVAVGAFSQNGINTNNTVTSFGYQSLYKNTGGNQSSFGTRSLLNVVGSSNSNNMAFGNDTLVNFTGGSNNTCFGGFALSNVVLTANNNSVFGFYSIYNATADINNTVAFGYQSGLNLNNSNDCCIFGYQSCLGGNNVSLTSFGSQSMMNNTTGTQNNSFGYQSMMNANTSYSNSIGCFSLFNSTGNYNTAIGSYSQHLTSTGIANSSFGNYSLYSNTTGTGNTTFGFGSMYDNTIGNYNCSFGTLSLHNNITGQNNVAFGHQSLNSMKYGNNNTTVGANALYYNISGDNNICIGSNTLIQCLNDFSVFFDGTEYCSMPQQSYYDNPSGTFECWITPFPVGYTSSSGNIVEKNSYYCIAYKNFAIFVRNGMVVVCDFYNNNVFYSNVVVSDGKWHHVALVYNPGIVNGSKLYIDGMLNIVFTFYGLSYGGTANNIAPNTLITDTIFRIGAFYTTLTYMNASYNNFIGGMDEVRMWNTLRSDSDILTNYNISVSSSSNGLIGYWKMNEGIGNTLYNYASVGYDFPIIGNVVWSSFTPTIYCSYQNNEVAINKYSLYFNKSNYGSLSSTTYYNYSTGTVECWVNFASFPVNTGYMGIFCKNYAYALFVYTNGSTTFLATYDWGASVVKLGITPLLLDTWYHVSLTFQSGIANGSKLYLNGELEWTGQITISNQNSVVYLGSGTNVLYLMHGYIDEVRIWNVVRTQSQILQTYNRRLNVNTPNLTGYWTMEQGGGNTLYNFAPGGYDFNLTNSPSFFSNIYSLKLNGTNQYGSLPSSTVYSLSTGTIECWVNIASLPTSATPLKGILVKVNAWGLYVSYDTNTNNSYFGFYNWKPNPGNSVGIKNGTTPLLTNVWYHVAYTFNQGVGSGSLLYVNGVLEYTGRINVADQTKVVCIGSPDGIANGQYLNGNIVQLRIWNVIRTNIQITEQYNKQLDPNTPNLVGHYIMQEGTNNSLINLSLSSTSNFTLFNSPSFENKPPPLIQNNPIDACPLFQYSYPSLKNISSNTSIYVPNSIKFDGTIDRANLSFSNSITDSINPYFYKNGTIEFWFNPISTGKCLINYGNYFYISITSTTELQLKNLNPPNGTNLITITAFTSPQTLLNQWNHFAMSYQDGITNGTSFYVNGNFIRTETVYVPNLLSFINNEYNQSFPYIELGYDNITNNYYDNYMNEIRFWNYPLLNDEIKNIYNKRVDPYTPGLIGYWSMDEGYSSVFKNLVKSGPNFIFNNPNPIWTQGAGPSLTNFANIDYLKIDENYPLINYTLSTNTYASYFNGINNYWTTNSVSDFAYSQGTIECWVYLSSLPTSTTIYRGILVKQYAYGIYAVYDTGTSSSYFASFSWGGTTGYKRGTTPLSVNMWYHVAHTFNLGATNGSLLYVNGVLENTATNTLVNQSVKFQIGWANASNQYMNGYIKEVRIWNIMRSQKEIIDTYKKIISVKTIGLTGYWNMEEGSGTTLTNLVSNEINLIASSPAPTFVNLSTLNSVLPIYTYDYTYANSNNNLLIGANTNLDIFAKNNYTCYFNNNSWVSPNNTDYSNTSGTIECWVNFTTLPAASGNMMGIIVKMNAYGLYAYNNSGIVYFMFLNYTGNIINYSITKISINIWYHIALSFQSNVTNGTSLYVNGMLEKTSTISFVQGSNLSFYIGSSNGISQFLNGYVDEVRIWNVVRTQIEILNTYDKVISVTTQGLIGYWNMEQGSGTTLYNLAPGGVNLTASATPPIFVAYSTLTSFINPNLYIGDYAGAIGCGSVASYPDSLHLGTAVGNVYIEGKLWVGNTLTVGTTVYTSSDKRIKKDVYLMEENQNTDNLTPISYFNTLIGKEEIGFIAQEVEKEYPFLVTMCDYDGYKSLNYNGIVAINVNEIKNLYKIYNENETLINRNAIEITKIKGCLKNDLSYFGNNIIV